MTRYQESPWYVRIWRRRHYLTALFKFPMLWWGFAHDPEFGFSGMSAMSFAWGCAIGMAQANMNWVYTQEEVEQELRDWCSDEGVNFDALIEGAAKFFAGPIVRRTEPLTEAELAALVEDDARAFGDKA